MDLDGGFSNNSITSGTRCGMVLFNDLAWIKFQLNTYSTKATLLQGFQDIYRGGGTNTADAIKMTNDVCFTSANGDRPSVKNVIVLVTDGRSNNTALTVQQAIRARERGISILAIGVGDYNYDELRAVASGAQVPAVLTAANYSSLSNVLVNQITSMICAVNDSCTPNPCKNGATCKNVFGGYECGPCPPGFTGALCERSCTGMVDIVLMLDVSGSINHDRFPMIKELIGDIVRQYDVYPNTTRFGCIYFSNTSNVAFNLNTYSTQQDVIQGIRDVPFLGGATDISAALKMLPGMYSDANGGRASATHLVIGITDGIATMNAQDTIPEAIKVKNANIEAIMVLVGANNYVDMNVAEALVSGSIDKDIIRVNNYTSLPNVTGDIVKATCNDVNECASSPCQHNASCINQYMRYTCVCPTSSAGYNCERTCTSRLDVVFVLDLSGGVIDMWGLVTLVRNIIYGLDVTNDQVRIGVVTYGSDVTNNFYLTTYSGNRQGVINSISFYPPSGTSNTQAALKNVQDNQLTATNGERAGIPNIVIVISDGYSDVTEGSSASANAAANLKQSGATVYTIAIGDSPNVVELQAIASAPAASHTFTLASTNSTDINNLTNQVLTTLCST